MMMFTYMRINSHAELAEMGCLFCCEALRQAQGDRTVFNRIIGISEISSHAELVEVSCLLLL
ncbi:hypothetical protein [Flavobacterium cerinum]|uniref:hypothetical protein n=1 Tax=Flavobacterium cerinum TaxID=2502784 RepID=UPI0019D45380|nr:hypothetical protein [Flavobacterium cerinum]